MIVEEVLKIYEGLIRDPSKLQKGDKTLEDLLSSKPDFGLITCKIITSSDFDIKFRKLTGYLIKNVLKDHWMTNSVLANQRKDIKEVLLNGLVLNVNDFKIVEMLSLIISELVKQEGIEAWQAYLKELIMWINSEDIVRISAGLEFLCLLFSINESKNGLHVLVPELLPVLFQVFTIPELPERQREKLLMLVYLAVDSFAWADSTQDEVVHQCFDRTYQEWMSLFISVLQTSARSRLNMKKYILKILTKIFSELPKYSMRTLGVMIQPVWKFLNATLPLYIWHVVYDVPVDDIEEGMKSIQDTPNKNKKKVPYRAPEDEGFELEEDAELSDDVEAMALQLIELMRTMVDKTQIRPLLKFGLFPLINCISHYMLFSRRMEQTWSSDLTEFIFDDKDESNVHDIRRKVLSCLSDLIENFSEEATQAIMVVSEKFLTNMKEEEVYGFLKDVFEKLRLTESKSPVLQDFDSEKLVSLVKTSHFEGEHPHHKWKKREIGLILMGSFAEDIVTFLTKKMHNYDMAKLVDRLVGDFYETNNPVLRGRALWCITQFSEVLAGKGVETLLSLYKLSATCLINEKILPVKLAAVKAVRTFAFKIQRFYADDLNDEDLKSEYKLNDYNVLDSLFEVLQEGDENLTYLILETIFLLTKINPEFIDQITGKLAPKIVKMFQKLIQSNQIGNLLKDIIRTFSRSEKAYNQLASAFLPYIYEILKFKTQTGLSLNAHVKLGKMSEEDFFATLFELTRLFVKSEASLNQTSSLMEILPLLLKLMLVSQDVNVLINASICLKAYVTHFNNSIIKMGYLPEIMNVITKILTPETNEMASLYIGNLIILVFANLLNNSVDTNILKQVITKLSKSKLPSIIQSLVLVYSRLINTNEKDALGFLSSFSLDNKLALKALVDKWCLQQPLFRGKNTRISTFLALTKLFMAKDPRVETLLVIGFNPSHSNMQEVYAPFKILSLLIRGLDAELRSRAARNGRLEKGGVIGSEGSKGFMSSNDDDGRLDTVEDEDFDDEDDYRDIDEEDRVQIDLDIQRDEDYTDLEKRFNIQGEKKGKGLADVESGSACYMSEMLDYDIDMEEADEIAEEDLIYLEDVSTTLDLVDMLKGFFVNLAKSDPEYFSFCLKHLLAEDADLLQKYIHFN